MKLHGFKVAHTTYLYVRNILIETRKKTKFNRNDLLKVSIAFNMTHEVKCVFFIILQSIFQYTMQCIVCNSDCIICKFNKLSLYVTLKTKKKKEILF